MNTLPRSIRWLLGVLIACNVALISFIVLMIWARTHGPVVGTESGWQTPPPGWLQESVPPERQGEVAEVLYRHRVAFRDRVLEVRAARQNLARLLADPALTREQLEEGFARLRRADQASSEQAHATLSEVLIDLRPAERMRVVRQMMMRQQQGPRRGRPDPRTDARDDRRPTQ
ncbi:MAG: periplasmic heavy metal sensor [Xanthomonadales bacterium]|nr:periplasmic heavy metal sensor [Xanthomonadales bacterium]